MKRIVVALAVVVWLGACSGGSTVDGGTGGGAAGGVGGGSAGGVGGGSAGGVGGGSAGGVGGGSAGGVGGGSAGGVGGGSAGGVGGGSAGGVGGGTAGGWALSDNSDCAVAVIDSNVSGYQSFNLALSGVEPVVAWASFGRMTFASRSLADGGWSYRSLGSDPGSPFLTAQPGQTLVAVSGSAARLFSVTDGGVTTVLGPYTVPSNQLLSLLAEPLGVSGARMTQLVQPAASPAELRTDDTTDAGRVTAPLGPFASVRFGALTTTADAGLLVAGLDYDGKLWAGPPPALPLVIDGGVSSFLVANGSNGTILYYRVNTSVARVQLPNGTPQFVLNSPTWPPAAVTISPSGQHLMLLPETQSAGRVFRLLAETGGLFREERRFSADWAGPIVINPDGGVATLVQLNRNLQYYECPRR